MDALEAVDFGIFFRELHDNDPFPWQTRLAKLVCETASWPRSLDLPTASGKTACLDIAVFAMAFRRRGPRRVFFVVDRRVVVDAAYERMKAIAGKLKRARGGILKLVADKLRAMSCGGEPLDTYQLRGGIYRDDSWVRSPVQPTLVASTVDQVGSRLLFRGYGVWDKQLPMHAGLIANDALILLDEAHCSRPFAETLESVRRYRGWVEEDLDAPFAFVEMTATPAEPDGAFRLEQEDYEHPKLHERLYASKPARTLVSPGRAKDFGKLADTLAGEAIELSQKPGLRRIAVMVNRVRTARAVYETLRNDGKRVHLLIGRMRPIDRLKLPEDVEGMLAGKKRASEADPVFVVATQCLEVGADLDFDGLVTECASIDALLQRFGRLDRLGGLAASGIAAQGRIVIAPHMVDAKEPDPVYGMALPATWKWIQSLGEPDFGICSDAGDVTVRECLQLLAQEEAAPMRRGAPVAPVLLPTHLDLLAQTSPRPALDPDVSLYLHGEKTGSPDVQVVWRADLDVAFPDRWAEVVALCPPVSTEPISVPIGDFKAWLTGQQPSATSSDIEGADKEQDQRSSGDPRCPVLRWRGDQSELIEDAARIRPGDTLVLATDSGGWEDLGHIPDEAAKDRAEEARLALRSRWILRLHPTLIGTWPENNVRARLLEVAGDDSVELSALRVAFEEYVRALNGGGPEWLHRMLGNIPAKVEAEDYPAAERRHVGWILLGRQAEADAGQDEGSASRPISLDRHLKDVSESVAEFAGTLVERGNTRQSLIEAAKLHDCGKADSRFQALLHGGDLMAAQLAPKLLAKGAVTRQSRQVRRARWKQSGLPDDFRHELISLLLVRQDSNLSQDDLALHLIASHHGRCRPFAPLVEDDGEDLSYNGWRISQRQRSEEAAHRLDSGVAARFWRVTRRYGWWGLAYLESLLRLGDWKASKEEEKPS
jgi:CRISPR-associated endonuclease/helicase Cas3